jgi:DNA-directed RNA polymerase specialized sigma24 family protein
MVTVLTSNRNIRRPGQNGSWLASAYDRFADVVYGLALRILGDGTRAEEVAASLFDRLGANPGLKNWDNLSSWLCAQTRRLALDARNRVDEAGEAISLDSEQEALEEAYITGRSYRDVASKLGVDTNSARQLIVAALRQLQ